MVQFAMQHPIASVCIIWIVCETVTVAVKDICSVLEKRTKLSDNLMNRRLDK